MGTSGDRHPRPLSRAHLAAGKVMESNGRHIDHWKAKMCRDEEILSEFRGARSRVMYIEDKSDGLNGPARIGRVFFSKSGKTVYYRGLKFQSLRGSGFKANYFEISSGDEYWISGPHKDQNDRLYGGNRGVVVDPGVAEEYRVLISGRKAIA